jgi:DNA processing protein
MEIQFYSINHSKYPMNLKEIPDPPYGIYVKGKLPMENIPSVAIIGARSCSEYGKYMARAFGIELAAAGIQIISGLARGIDGIGQKAALEAEGATFAILGSGVDICYPEENITLYKNILSSKQGGIVSEFKPGILPKPSFFPMRNRIISGLADIVLVIEAKEKSGTLITVDMALEQGREVYALPGRATDALSYGCNKLIKQGAGIALSPKDLLSEILFSCGKTSNHHVKTTIKAESNKGESNKAGNTINIGEKSCILNPLELLILNLLDLKSASMEELYQYSIEHSMCEIHLPEVIWQVMELCMNGYVIQENGVYSKVYHNR